MPQYPDFLAYGFDARKLIESVAGVVDFVSRF
jgi:hypothetical protein